MVEAARGGRGESRRGALDLAEEVVRGGGGRTRWIWRRRRRRMRWMATKARAVEGGTRWRRLGFFLLDFLFGVDFFFGVEKIWAILFFIIFLRT